MAKKEGIEFLGRLPVDTALVDLLDDPVNANASLDPDLATTGFGLLDKYRQTPSCGIFVGMAGRVVELLEGRA